jgi:hypothetical protein
MADVVPVVHQSLFVIPLSLPGYPTGLAPAYDAV